MIRKYITIAIRNFQKNRLFTSINVFGLSMGIACSLCILLFVLDEQSYDKHFANGDRLFRVIQFDEEGEGSSLPFPVTTTLQHDFPDIISTQARLFNFQASTLAITCEAGADKKSFNEPHFFFADSTFFEVFGFDLIEGDPETALAGPGKVVITRSTAEKYFGTTDVLDKNLKFEGKYDLAITGVMEDVPENTHFRLDFVASFHSLNQLFDGGIPEKNWYWNPVWGYVVLKNPDQKNELASQLKFFADKYYHPSLVGKVSLMLQSVEDIYLHSKSEYEIHPMSDVRYSYVFSMVGIAILIVASINFINLTTSQAAQRFKEIGVRKIMGASRPILALQFFAESFFVVIIASVVGLCIALAALPFLNDLTGKRLALQSLVDIKLIAAFVAIVLFVGLLSGVYPAMLLSSRRALAILKPGTTGFSSGVWLRKFLVVVQFVLAIVFVSGTLIVFQQVRFLRDKNLGFESEEIIMLPVQRLSLVPKYETFKERLLTFPAITSVSSVNTILGRDFQSSNYKKEGESDDALTLKPCLFVRNDFLRTAGVEILAGQDFSLSMTAPGFHAIINKTFAAEYGWVNPEDAVGKVIEGTLEGKITVIGVSDNFHFAPLKDAIGPLIMIRADHTQWDEFFTRFVMIRVKTNDLQPTLEFLRKEWNAMVAESPFDFFFLNDNLQQNYVSEIRFNKIISVFSFIAIGISMLGIFGLASYTIHRRTKEVSIRKVLGASLSSLLSLLAKDFVRLILLASFIAVPASVYLSIKWLDGFAYKIELDPIYFAASVLSIAAIAAITIVYVILKAARVNPAETLRND